MAPLAAQRPKSADRRGSVKASYSPANTCCAHPSHAHGEQGRKGNGHSRQRTCASNGYRQERQTVQMESGCQAEKRCEKKDRERRDSASINEAVAIFADSSVCRAPQRAAVWTEPASRQEDATPPRKPGPSGGLRGADAPMRPLPTQHRQQNPAGRHDFVGQESHATAEGSKAKK